jgi:hypothetical protein
LGQQLYDVTFVSLWNADRPAVKSQTRNPMLRPFQIVFASSLHPALCELILIPSPGNSAAYYECTAAYIV